MSYTVTHSRAVFSRTFACHAVQLAKIASTLESMNANRSKLSAEIERLSHECSEMISMFNFIPSSLLSVLRSCGVSRCDVRGWQSLCILLSPVFCMIVCVCACVQQLTSSWRLSACVPRAL